MSFLNFIVLFCLHYLYRVGYGPIQHEEIIICLLIMHYVMMSDTLVIIWYNV